ncbi:MAG: nicotinate-nucleotide adenylyltransferase [Chloroflexota bacterium]
MKLGVLGGTFDPVHRGHLMVAEEARAELGLDEVLFVPAGDPWLKSDRTISPAGHRVAMLRLAIAGKLYFKLSLLEIERPGPSYTVDTLAELRRGLKAGDEIYLIMGWGSLAELPRWHQPSRVIPLCRLAVAPRPGVLRPDLATLEKSIPGISEKVVFLRAPEMDISATDIRERVRKGLPIGHLVPEAVAKYIEEHGLYRY